MKKIAVLAFDDVVPFDLAIPCGVFGFAFTKSGDPAYDVRVCGPKKTAKASPFDIHVSHGLDAIFDCSTLIVPGIATLDTPTPPSILKIVREAVARKIRVASICSGSFILARAGVLDGLEVTTHWVGVEQMRKDFPQLRVNPDVLYVDHGSILTSAGAAAGMDLCLHLIRKDYGAKIAADAARYSVVPLERHGGQAQFIKHTAPSTQDTLSELLIWMERHSHRPLTIEDLALKAKTSPRTLIRKFKLQVGVSPLQWLIRTRIAKGQALLEGSDLSVEQISEKVGFGLGTSFREHFRKHVGLNPQAYRANFTRSH